MDQPPVRRRAAPVFRPRFTLMLLYLASFFLLFAFMFMLPDLVAAWRQGPPEGVGASDQELQAWLGEVGRRALSRPRFLTAVFGAIAATVLGAWRRALPGLR